jgi:hypothetical protein
VCDLPDRSRDEASINVAAKTGMRREREAPIDGEPTLMYSLVQP